MIKMAIRVTVAFETLEKRLVPCGLFFEKNEQIKSGSSGIKRADGCSRKNTTPTVQNMNCEIGRSTLPVRVSYILSRFSTTSLRFLNFKSAASVINCIYWATSIKSMTLSAKLN